MEFNRKKVIRELDALHHRILNSKLAEKITEKEIMAIINAAILLIEDGKEIKELTEEAERLNTNMDSMVVEHKRLVTITKTDTVRKMLAEAEYVAEYSEDFGCPVVLFDKLLQIGEGIK